MPRWIDCWLSALALLGFAGGESLAAVLVPVVPVGPGFEPGVGASLSTTSLRGPGESIGGPTAPWDLEPYRATIDVASVTIDAEFDSTGVRIDAYGVARDPILGDLLTASEARPEVRDLWFRVEPSGSSRPGDRVPLYLALDWRAASDQPGTPPWQNQAILSTPTISSFSKLLQGRTDSDVVQATVGEVYKVTLTTRPSSEANNELLVGAGSVYAGLVPFTPTAPEAVLPGDYNRDGIVDAADYTVWRDAATGPYDFNVDGNGDGVIDAGDLEVLNNWYGVAIPSGSALGVPEPASIAQALSLLSLTKLFRSRARQ